MDVSKAVTAVISLLVGAGGVYSFGAIKTPAELLADAQVECLAEYGKYCQAHEYQAPNGVGYQIVYETATEVRSVGFGPEAEPRTYTRLKPHMTATSTR